MSSITTSTTPLSSDSTTAQVVDMLRRCNRAGVSALPVNMQTKAPATDGGKWADFQNRLPTPTEIEGWIKKRPTGAGFINGQISGGIFTIETERPEDTEAFEAIIDPAILARLCTVRSGGKGGNHYHAKAENPVKSETLAQHPKNPDGTPGKVRMELLGENKFCILPGSRHPSGRVNEVTQGDFFDLPVLGDSEIASIIEAAKTLDLRPPKPVPAVKTTTSQGRNREGESVIDAYNAKHTVEEELRAHGYIDVTANRMKRPGGNTGSVHVLDGKSFHHSASDPLNGEHAHDAFSVRCNLDFGGDAKNAVKAISLELGMNGRNGNGQHNVNGHAQRNGSNGQGKPTHRISDEPDADPADEMPAADAGQDAAMEPADDLAEFGIGPDTPARNIATSSEAIEPPSTPDDNLAFLTELENSRRLLRARGDDLRYVPGWGWFYWDGSRWKLDELGIVAEWMKGIIRRMWAQMPHAADRKALARFINESERHSKITAAINLARTDPAVAIKADRLDADPWLIGHPTCVTDLKTGQTRAGRRADLITKSTAVDPADIPITLFLSFIDRTFDRNADLIAYVKKLLGMFLTGDITEQAIWFFIGSGSNGKSVLVDLILFILADYGLLAPPDLLTVRPHGAGHPTDLASLFGVRLAVVSETPSGATMELSRMKALTGDANITARRMRENFITKARTHKTALVTNHPLRINDASEAVWRRIQKVPFSVTIPARERDPKLLAKLKAEAPGILRWMIDGCIQWQRDGLNPPAIVVQATAQYKDAETPGGDYISDRLTLTPRARLSRAELYQDYQSYSVQTGDKFPMEKAELFAAVRALSGVSEGKWKRPGTDIAIRGFLGVGVAGVADGGTTSRCFSIPDSHERLTAKPATTCHHLPQPSAKGDGNPELSGDYSMDEVQVRR